MKTASSTVALIATLLLHAALIAAVMAGLSPRKDKTEGPPPILVQLLPPPAENTPPAPLPMAAAPDPPRPEKKRPEPKRIAKSKESMKPREPVAPKTKDPEPIAPRESEPSTSTTTALPAPTAPVPVTLAPSTQPARAATAPPVKTGVSVNASYVAIETEKFYPRLSRRYEEQGTVLLRVYISAAGRAEKVELKKSSNIPSLDQAADSLARSLQYIPAKLDGNPVADWTDLPVTFKLKN
jgi:protein TonB